MSVAAALEHVLTTPTYLYAWAVLVALSVAVVVSDLVVNQSLASLMEFVWVLTVLYSGPLGLAIYWHAGRAQIPNDSLWRRGARSTAHCYSGCGAGEVAGVVLAATVLALATVGTVALTFACAYIAGMALTVGPLVQEGVGVPAAVRDAFYSETPSITVMEVVAISVDVWLAGEATVAEPLFWSALLFSLSVGFLAAYPVNVALVSRGVKAGMADPSAA
ncbi:MAG: DUF4396 domain-containing protein [Halorientalis sp.]